MTARAGPEESAGAAPAVRLRGVRKRLGYRDILRGIDLEVPRGACFVIFGPNGAGKSTVLRIIATQWTYSAGEVEVLGRDLRRERLAVRRQTGLVFHDSFLRRELTLEENMRFACDLYGLDFRAAAPQIDELLDRFGLLARKKDPVATFSQGMAKRASIVRSLLNRPVLWILDEPFSGLDTAGQEILERMIEDFPRAGGTVILVTHQEERGFRLARASARLEEGQVVSRGRSPAAGASRPLPPPAAQGEVGVSAV